MTLYPSPIFYPGTESLPGPDDLTGYATSVGKLSGENVVTGQGSGSSTGAPIIYVSVAFDSDLTKTPNWIDVTPWVRAIDIRRGRQMELDEFQTGTCSIVLDGNDGRFNPQRSDGPYVGYLTPLRRVRVFVAYQGSIYYLWQGFAESWEPGYRNGGDDETVTLRAADAFKLLAAKEKKDVYLQPKRPTDRIAEVLAGLPGIEYVSAGNGTVYVKYEAVTSTTSVLSLAKTAAAADLGVIFCDERGRVRFEPRTYRSLSETTDRYTFGEDTTRGEIPYSDAEFAYNDEQVYTEVRVTAQGQVASVDSTASSAYTTTFGERTLSITVPIVKGTATSAPDNDPDSTTAASFATQLLNRYQLPGVRLNEITLNAFSSTTALGAVLNTQLGHRVRVLRRPAWSTLAAETSTDKVTGLSVLTTDGGMVNLPVFVERVEHSIRPGQRWVVKYGMSPADALAYFDVPQSTLPSTSAGSTGATDAATTTSSGTVYAKYGTTTTSRSISV